MPFLKDFIPSKSKLPNPPEDEIGIIQECVKKLCDLKEKEIGRRPQSIVNMTNDVHTKRTTITIELQ